MIMSLEEELNLQLLELDHDDMAVSKMTGFSKESSVVRQVQRADTEQGVVAVSVLVLALGFFLFLLLRRLLFVVDCVGGSGRWVSEAFVVMVE